MVLALAAAPVASSASEPTRLNDVVSSELERLDDVVARLGRATHRHHAAMSLAPWPAAAQAGALDEPLSDLQQLNRQLS